MLKFKSSSIPEPSKGLDCRKWKRQVVPDQSLSLKEILTRFVRREPLPVGRQAFGDPDLAEEWTELDIDLEKVSAMDLTEQTELKEKLQGIQDNFKAQEAGRKKKAADEAAKAAKAAEEERIEKEVARRVSESRKRPPGGSADS